MPKEFEVIEENAVNSPVEDIKWYGKEEETEQALMHDNGKGEIIDLRSFVYKFPIRLETPPTKEEILTPSYLQFLRTTLWADDLRMVLEPRVHIDNDGYIVMATCQARNGRTFVEAPRLLQEWTK